MPGQGRVCCCIDLRRVRVLVVGAAVEIHGDQAALIRVGAGAIDDDVLPPAVEGVPVRVGEAEASVGVELLRPRFVAEDAGVGATHGRPVRRFHLV